MHTSDTTKKIALVTHVTDYAGPAAVHGLLNAGFRVVAQHPSIYDEQAKSAFEQQYPGVETTAIADPDQLISYVWQRHAGLDALISNDAFPAVHISVEDANIDDLQATIDALMLFPFKLIKAAIPHLKQQGHGNVIMITSCRDELPLPGGAIPDMARAGANALMRSLSIELAPHNVAVNAIGPNYLYSEAYFPRAKFIHDPHGSQFIRDVVPAGRLGTDQELGELVCYLASMQGAFHTGSLIKFAGGWPAAPQRPV